MDSIISEGGLACVPAIHIYLKDLIFIDTAHPVSEEPQLRETKINQVLSKVSKLQESAYQNLNQVSPECTKYMSNACIEYLQDDVLQVRMQTLSLFLETHLSKCPSDLKQKCTQFPTPFLRPVFHALSHGVIHFYRSVSF